MTTQKVITKDPDETMGLGERLAKNLKQGDIVCLFGELGSGKTTLVKGIAKGLKVHTAAVNSPTFVLMNAYEGRLLLFHFDLYRLEDTKEISAIGYDEFLYNDGVAVVEWADRLGELLPKEYLQVDLKHKTPNERVIQLSAHGARYQKIVEQLRHNEHIGH